MEALTALQWAKEGYVPNADAIGNERWTNCHHAQKATYYKASEVHENADAAREIIKLNRKEYNQASKKREEKRKKTIAFRELMKTEWQWLQEGRIPNPNARWEYAVTAANIAIVILMKHIYPKIVKSYKKPFLIFIRTEIAGYDYKQSKKEVLLNN